MIIIICIATFVFTLLGGLFALKFKDKLHLILGFSAGAVIGVAFFDLLPESIELGSGKYDISTITTIVAIGFAIYMILDRFVILHSHNDDEEIRNEKRGMLGAGSFSLHSFLDGIAIGLAFQVSNTVGTVVAIAVLVHKISDGINTVNMILKNNGDKSSAIKWLLVSAIAPVIGIISASVFQLEEATLGIILAIFTGFFLYIGASDLLPESHHNHPTVWTTFLTVLGILVMYIAIHLVH
jgi:ZIP family zinc transporter